jgi:hypothetical protein
MNNRGPRIVAWGTPSFNVPQSEKRFLVVGFAALFFYFFKLNKT